MSGHFKITTCLQQRLHARAFTIVELLVVVAIIALLIALLVPGLKTAKETARVALCLANVRQLTTASLNYVTDHNGFFVPTNTPEALGKPYAEQGKGKFVSFNMGGAMWMDPIWEMYLSKRIEVMECPDQKSRRNFAATYQYMGPGGYREYFPGYLINRQVLNHNTFLPTNVMSWKNPSEKILHGDSGKRLLNGAYAPEVLDGWGPLSPQWWVANAQSAWSGAGLSGRHFAKLTLVDTNPTFADTDISGGSNVVFLDGHGEFRDWIHTSPWRSITVNGSLPTSNAGRDLFRKYWDPDGDGNQFTP